MPSRGSYHVDKRLTDYAVGYAANNTTWVDDAFPVLPVTEQSGLYPVYGAESYRVRNLLIGTSQTNWPSVDYEFSDASYTVKPKGAEHFVPNAIEAQYRTQEEEIATELIMDAIALEQAKTCADYVTDSSNVTNAGTAVDLDTADPQDYFQDEATTIRNRCGVRPDTVIMGWDVVRAIMANSTFTGLVKYTVDIALSSRDKAALYKRLVGDYIGLNVVCPETLYDTANEGATASLGEVWPTETALIYHRGATSGMDRAGRGLTRRGRPTFAVRIYWTGDRFGEGIAVWRIKNEQKGMGGWDIRGAHWYQFAVCFDDAATLCTDVLTGSGS